MFHDLLLPFSAVLLALQLALGIVSWNADRSAEARLAAAMKTRKRRSDEPPQKAGVILPPPVQQTMFTTHIMWALTVVIGILAQLSGQGAPKFNEYMLLFTGGGILYQRGLLPKGWVQRLLTEPPRATRLMIYGCGWCFAAVLGYLFQANLPAPVGR